jgi:hypothetical protein
MKFANYSNFFRKYTGVPAKRAYRLAGVLFCAPDCDSKVGEVCTKLFWSFISPPQKDAKTGAIITPAACIKQGKLKIQEEK